MRLIKNTVIAFAQESSYAQLPTFSYDNLLEVENVDLSLQHENKTFNPYRKEMGIKDVYKTGIHVQLAFDVPLKGDGLSGTAVIEPQIGKLLEACLFSKSTDADNTYWLYQTANGIVGEEFPSVAFEVYHARNEQGLCDKYTIVGAVGTWTLTITAGEIVKIRFTFTGLLYNAPETTNYPDVSYINTDLLIAEGVNFSFDTNALCVNEMSIDCGNSVVTFPCMNAVVGETKGIKRILINGREMTGSIDPEALLISDYDFFAKLKNNDKLSMSVALGSEAGNKVTISSDSVIVRGIDNRDRNDFLVYGLDLAFVQPDGGSELSIKFE